MTTVLLLTENLKPIPSTAKVLANWGDVTIHTEIDGKEGWETGEHVYLEDTPENISNWLRPFAGVWVGRGSPMAQEFHIMHIK
jgi:hypothetical protein